MKGRRPLVSDRMALELTEIEWVDRIEGSICVPMLAKGVQIKKGGWAHVRC